MHRKRVDCDEEQQEHCDRVYISWVWGIGIIISSVAVIAGGSYAYASHETKQETTIEDQSKSITDIVTRVKSLERMGNDLDSIKYWVRRPGK
jgi:uncharacterized membrane protein YukC